MKRTQVLVALLAIFATAYPNQDAPTEREIKENRLGGYGDSNEDGEFFAALRIEQPDWKHIPMDDLFDFTLDELADELATEQDEEQPAENTEA